MDMRVCRCVCRLSADPLAQRRFLPCFVGLSVPLEVGFLLGIGHDVVV